MAANYPYGPSLPNFSVFQCYLLPLRAVTLYALNVPERHCKNTTFPQTRKGMEQKTIYSTRIWLMFHLAYWYLLLNFILPAFILTLHFKDAFVHELFEVVAGS